MGSVNEKAYQELYKRIGELNKKSETPRGEKQTPEAQAASRERHKLGAEARQMEREAARDGVHLVGGQKVRETSTKRSLQEEYVRKFERAAGPGESEPVVKIIDQAHPPDKPFVGKLSEFHRQRLLKR